MLTFGSKESLANLRHEPMRSARHNIKPIYIWTADKDVNGSDPRINVHYLDSSENKAWKKFRPVRIWTHDLCTGIAEVMEKPIITYSVALASTFLSAENENRQLEDLSPTDFGRLPERLLRSVRTKSINENFVNWKLGLLLF